MVQGAIAVLYVTLLMAGCRTKDSKDIKGFHFTLLKSSETKATTIFNNQIGVQVKKFLPCAVY